MIVKRKIPKMMKIRIIKLRTLMRMKKKIDLDPKKITEI